MNSTHLGTIQPEVGSLWRDREGVIWRLDHYIEHSSYVILKSVEWQGEPFPGAIWHCDPIIDLKPPKAYPVAQAEGFMDTTEQPADQPKTGDRVSRHGTVSFHRSGFVRVRWDDGRVTEEWGPDLEIEEGT
jgi:hypothetical protein